MTIVMRAGLVGLLSWACLSTIYVFWYQWDKSGRLAYDLTGLNNATRFGVYFLPAILATFPVRLYLRFHRRVAAEGRA